MRASPAWASGLAAAAAALAIGCGGGDGDAGDAFEAVEQRESERERQQRQVAAPRWEPLQVLEGSGDATETVTVDEEAIRWRASWRCGEGEFELRANGERLSSKPCPSRDRWSSIETGELEFEVKASARWELRIWQQVTSPLREPPPEEVASGEAELIATGAFYRIENRGRGGARLYQLPSGRLALRMEGFSTAANTDLFVWISEDPRPRTTNQAMNAPHEEIAVLKSTLGDQNYLFPEGFDPARARSVVIWCEPVQIAYTAAALTPRGPA